MRTERKVKYQQVREGILQNIEARVHAVGESIPSEHELCRIYGVSRSTIRQAVKDLVDEGVLATWQGKGTYVIGLAPATPATAFVSQVQARERPQYRLVRFEATGAIAEVAVSLNVPPGSPVFFFERLRLNGDDILGVKRAYILEKALGGNLPTKAELESSLIDEILARRGLPVRHVAFNVRPHIFTGDDCRLTGTPENTLGLRICRIGYSAVGNPLRVSDTLFRSDKVIPSFSVSIPPDGILDPISFPAEMRLFPHVANMNMHE